MSRIRIAFATLGCKTNQYDTAAILGKLDPNVFQVVDFQDRADVYLINTCTVTAVADRQSRQLAYRARRTNPDAKIFVSGCYATWNTESLRAAKEIDAVFPRTEKGRIVEELRKLAENTKSEKGEAYDSGPVFPSRTRPFLKVQDGCDAVCTYCIIPRVRGPIQSDSIEDVLMRLDRLADQGVHETVLTGIHIGRWGLDLYGRPSLIRLLEAIEARSRVPRIRISSLEPLDLTDEIIALLADSRVFLPHLHIPLQNGADEILAAMKRPYRTRHYRDRVERAAEAIPGLGLGIDVIVGFPGETEALFEETRKFLESLPFTYLHVFPYSRRPGTPADRMPGQVDPQTRKRRTETLIRLSDERRRDEAARWIGKELSVLVESKPDKKTGFPQGFSSQYHHVLVEYSEDISDRVVTVRATGLADSGFSLLARVLP